MASEKAANKPASPRLYALAIANINKLFDTAFAKLEHSDTHGRKEVKHTIRLGSLLFDPQTKEFVPTMLTILEYVRDGNRVYSIESIDLGKTENSAGQLVASANGERQTPITKFKKIVAKRAVEFKQATGSKDRREEDCESESAACGSANGEKRRGFHRRDFRIRRRDSAGAAGSGVERVCRRRRIAEVG